MSQSAGNFPILIQSFAEKSQVPLSAENFEIFHRIAQRSYEWRKAPKIFFFCMKFDKKSLNQQQIKEKK